MRPRVLFVTYEASRTGSPTVLLRLLRWLRDEADVDASVLCWRGGPLVEELGAVAAVDVVGPLGRRTMAEVVEDALGEAGATGSSRRLRDRRLRRRLSGRGPWDLVYCNGAPSLTALPHVDRGSAPVLLHVHELSTGLERSLPAPERDLVQRADRYVAVSGAVRELLETSRSIPGDRITVIPGFVDDEPPSAVTPVATLRATLGIPPGAKVVGAAGQLIERKGPDLFVELARSVGGPQPPHFVWIGGDADPRLAGDIRTFVEAADLQGRVHLVGEQDRPFDWYRLFDVLVLPSREDPFPLVCLEAASVGTPVAAFDQGGLAELAGPDHAVRLAPALEVEALAGAVEDLLADDVARAALGERGRGRVREGFVTSVVAPLLLAEIEGLLGAAS